MPDWDALRRRVAGDVLLPGSDAYEWARKPFIARFDEIVPQAVVRCTASEDVAQVLAFARRYEIETSIRSGGHCLAGFSSTRGIVIDMTPMNSIAVDDGVVRVGAGTRTGELCTRLAERGLAIPTGTCPSVGIAGLTLGGGLGILGRAHGLTLDHLLAAQVVLADGRIVDCDEQHHPDLFWALRGAGAGNFGVVTSFTFRSLPAPRMSNFRLVWPYPHAAAAVEAWQEWAPQGPDELSADLVLAAPDDAEVEPAVEVYGAVIGSERDAYDLLAELTVRVGGEPQSEIREEASYADTCRYQAEVSVAYDQVEQTARGQRLRQGYRFTKSEFFARPLTSEAIAALIDTFAAGRRRGESRSVGFAPWGGAYNRPPAAATAFVHRDQLFSLEHIVVVDPQASGDDKQSAREWVERSWASVHPWGSGRVYPCFPDPDLADWGRAYYGDNHPRLLEIKRNYDPSNVFRSDQSLAVR
jgi:FAD/FMN-containing dehydrogenase